MSAKTLQLAVSGAKVVLQTASCAVIDDLLPERACEAVYNWAERLDFHHINTEGKVERVWNPSCGFPMRSVENFKCMAPGVSELGGVRTFPVRQAVDEFMLTMNSVLPHWAHLIGRADSSGWRHYSVSAWVYPPNTALAMHADGAGVYSGAYVYFLTPYWRAHWGGLLVVMDEETNAAIDRGAEDLDPFLFRGRRWLHASPRDDAAFERGIGHCILPKRNRLVLLAPDAFHLVTKVLPECGDNVRVSLGGFFIRGGWGDPVSSSA